MRLIKLISKEKENEMANDSTINYCSLAIVKSFGAHHIITAISVERNGPFIWTQKRQFLFVLQAHCASAPIRIAG